MFSGSGLTESKQTLIFSVIRIFWISEGSTIFSAIRIFWISEGSTIFSANEDLSISGLVVDLFISVLIDGVVNWMSLTLSIKCQESDTN